MVVAGLAGNAATTREWSTSPFGDVDITACLNALVDSVDRATSHHLGDAEALLMAQAVALNAVFTQLAHRAQINLGQYLDASERYLRLALKAQGQCRATLETLAVIKNPPTVFARQANIAHGPQQVNNGLPPPSHEPEPLTRAANQEPEPIKLLEAHGERLEFGAAGQAGHGDPVLAVVGARHRPSHGGG
jgi:hypothetical protein